MTAIKLPALGAKPAETRPNQPRVDGLHMMLARAPLKLDRSHVNPSPLMLDNNVLGNCTSAGLANSFRAVSALNGYMTDVTSEQAVTFYSQSTGYVPGNSATDNGGVEVDVLAYAAKNGYDVGEQKLYPIWGSMNEYNRNSIALAMANLGPVYLGVQLAVADQAGMGGLWDTPTPASYGDPHPGSWGGHCLLAHAYTGLGDDDVVTLLTWGTEQRCTWRWLVSRIMESHAILWPQLATPGNGFLSIRDLDAIKDQNRVFLDGK